MLEQLELIEAPVFPVVVGEKIILNVKRVKLSEEQFRRLCADNPELQFELSAQRELIIVPLSYATALFSTSHGSVSIVDDDYQ